VSGPLPGDAALRRVPLPAPYVYRSALKRGLARALDFGGALLWPRSRPRSLADGARIAVLRLDHLGDLCHALPALRALKRSLPRASVDLWVGPWGRDLAGLFADVDRVQVAEADWFRRPHRVEWPWGQIRGLGRALKAQRYDAVIDLRGDLRHHIAAALSAAPIRIGQTLTAGAFLLTHPGRWRPELHEQEQSLRLWQDAGLAFSAPAGKAPYLRLPAAALREAAALLRDLKAGPSPIMIQAACGTLAKRWDPRHWRSVIAGLPAKRTVILLGSAQERPEMLALARGLKRPVAQAAGRLGLPGLAALVGRAGLLISVDSGPAHLAAVQGRPVLSLFSGTNRAEQWAPRGPKVKVLRASGFPCSPCELSECPYGNACMNALAPAEVLKEALRMLR
jgi:ADP-heptose:LPS heptosyltransferase